MKWTKDVPVKELRIILYVAGVSLLVVGKVDTFHLIWDEVVYGWKWLAGALIAIMVGFCMKGR